MFNKGNREPEDLNEAFKEAIARPNGGVVAAAIAEGGIPEGYKPVEVEFFRFEKPGEHLEGVLLSRTRVTLSSGPVPKYTVHKANNELVSFLGTSRLDELMALVPNGRSIWIQYIGDQPTGDGKSPAKIFKVFQK